MGNHYHLCLQTAEANLVEGMRWLQSSFANRFNRFRKSNGHVFQGRYQAILLDGDAGTTLGKRLEAGTASSWERGV
jgi:putative transposase